VNPPNAGSDFALLRDAPMADAGLPPRIVAALAADGRAQIRDLCDLDSSPGQLDADDRSLLARVAQWCAAAERAAAPPLGLLDWIALFLPPRPADAVRLHYGLLDPLPALSAHDASLRDTAFKLGVTRERTRQILAAARHVLQCPLPLLAAAPLFRCAENALLAGGGALAPAAVAQLADAAWGDASPVGAFLLLSRLAPHRIAVYRELFSTLSPRDLERIELAARDAMAAANSLVSVHSLAADLRTHPGLLPALLRRLPDVVATLDHRAGIAVRDASQLLREILVDLGESPLRRIVEAFNLRVHPESRRGSGFVRDALRRDPRVLKTAPARYALPGGLQTRLPLLPSADA
jgi:hypothetical protein